MAGQPESGEVYVPGEAREQDGTDMQLQRELAAADHIAEFRQRYQSGFDTVFAWGGFRVLRRFNEK